MAPACAGIYRGEDDMPESGARVVRMTKRLLSEEEEQKSKMNMQIRRAKCAHGLLRLS